MTFKAYRAKPSPQSGIETPYNYSYISANSNFHRGN